MPCNKCNAPMLDSARLEVQVIIPENKENLSKLEEKEGSERNPWVA